MSIILVLSSVTYALKAQELMKKEGIYTALTRSNAVRTVKGCGYGLQLPEIYKEQAICILDKNNIKLLGILSAVF